MTHYTGTDMCIRTCRAEGYAVVKHGRRVFDPKELYELTISNPRRWTSRGRLRPPYGDLARVPAYALSQFIDYETLWKHFETGGESIKDFCDFANCPFPRPDQRPTFSDFVQLAQTVFYFNSTLFE
jgi:hypothetical protein